MVVIVVSVMSVVVTAVLSVPVDVLIPMILTIVHPDSPVALVVIVRDVLHVKQEIYKTVVRQ